MKKIYYWMTIIIAAMAMTACSSDAIEGSDLIVNNSDSEVSVNRVGGFLEIPIAAKGHWTASIDKEAKRWADVWTTEGNGAGVIKVNVDYLNPAKQIQERKATITVQNGSQKQLIELRQYIGLKDGETAPNADTEPYYDLWLSKGVGLGFDPTTGKMTDAILNPRGMGVLAKDHPEYASLLLQTNMPGLNGVVTVCDTMESNIKGIEVEATIKVKYATFNLDINAVYKNKGEQKFQNSIYNITQDVAFLKSTTSIGSVSAILAKDSLLDKQETRMIVTQGFKSTYDEIIRAAQEKDTAYMKEVVEDMCENYGPYVVTGATLGGSIFISLCTDSTLVADSFKVNGQLQASLLIGPVKTNGKLDVKYEKLGKDLWSKSAYYISISGGNANAYTEVANLMTEREPDLPAIQKAAKEWMSSIVSSNNEKDNTATIDLRYSPIWNLFPFSIRKTIREKVIELYKNKKLCSKLKPSDFPIMGDDGK